MTFEQWWDEHWAEFFPTGDHRGRILFAYDKERLGSEVKQVAAACWNAALDAAKEHSYPMAQLIASRAVAVDELDDMKVVGA